MQVFSWFPDELPEARPTSLLPPVDLMTLGFFRPEVRKRIEQEASLQYVQP